jgi:hypothetical protein
MSLTFLKAVANSLGIPRAPDCGRCAETMRLCICQPEAVLYLSLVYTMPKPLSCNDHHRQRHRPGDVRHSVAVNSVLARYRALNIATHTPTVRGLT